LQLKQLFGFCGAVVDSSLQGTAQDYAFVEYSNEEVRSFGLFPIPKNMGTMLQLKSKDVQAHIPLARSWLKR